MKPRMMALSALAILVVASTVNATPPAQERFSAFVEAQYLGSCADFALLTDYYFDLSYKLFYDSSGNPVRDFAVIRVDGWSKYYNSENPARFVEGGPNEVQVSQVEFDGNIMTFMGAAFRINLPGQGVILLTAGRLMVDLDTGEVLFMAGPQDLQEGNLDAICAALR